MAFEENHNDNNIQSHENIDFELPRARSNLFLRTIISGNNAILQDNDLMNQKQTVIRRDQNSTYYKDRKGRICVLCKWEFVPCCQPSICQKHRIRFNECID
ncbi:unnamed protein product [Adineta steineri]|uniref:Uncharacterized protein n=1 Tax=Adineta steineri TaxID=433720 RepID=A0A815STM4_9BILA|nr:unnamed protein product [Adineta steineri]CAF1643345.1 unnamed protein product [Adineta steineri]